MESHEYDHISSFILLLVVLSNQFSSLMCKLSQNVLKPLLTFCLILTLLIFQNRLVHCYVWTGPFIIYRGTYHTQNITQAIGKKHLPPNFYNNRQMLSKIYCIYFQFIYCQYCLPIWPTAPARISYFTLKGIVQDTESMSFQRYP